MSIPPKQSMRFFLVWGILRCDSFGLNKQFFTHRFYTYLGLLMFDVGADSLSEALANSSAIISVTSLQNQCMIFTGEPCQLNNHTHDTCQSHN